ALRRTAFGLTPARDDELIPRRRAKAGADAVPGCKTPIRRWEARSRRTKTAAVRAVAPRPARPAGPARRRRAPPRSQRQFVTTGVSAQFAPRPDWGQCQERRTASPASPPSRRDLRPV